MPTTQPRTEVYTDEYKNYQVTFTETLHDYGRTITVEPVPDYSEGFSFEISHDNAIAGPHPRPEDKEANERMILVWGWLTNEVLDLPDPGCGR